MSAPVVTRFAPSPTGFLHIGGARTALFNWLYARHTGGKMLLRIEDTDRERSTDAAIAAILDGLKWLGLDWEGEPIFQFARMDRHAEIAHELLARGHAYRCYASQAELEAMRETAMKEGRPPRYDGRWRDRDPAEAPEGVRPVIRLKAPQTGETVIDDQVQGRVVFRNDVLDDFILLRSDGTPTYMLAVVVDDHDMGVTHIIRGDDHLTNAARQTQIYQAMGWSVPVMAHVPLIHGPDGAKLSKRHGALGVDAYRALGYLPEALRNYLCRLGWSHGDDEVFSTAEAVGWFEPSDINRAATRFDFAKLEHLNGMWIRRTADADLHAEALALIPYLPNGAEFAPLAAEPARSRFLEAMPGLKERARTLIELLDGARFLIAERPLPLDEKAAQLLDAPARATLAGLLAALEPINDWSAASTETAVRAYAEATGLKLGKAAQPLRAALTGRSTSPGIFDVLAVLGREESLARIRDQAAA
ncbi:glutamate--tRNA ligase [Prosthecomicrobium hirschii]|uniref:glutamate--tRNA ligase n=1 Tax=Prosthecodimorpha hirschii TaxID=665126 RepID=UPI00112EE1CE|nr:glutamate--tRNA ligase [Prosthecomicrobium hirschii]MCW1839829.1 glutamate--tRNA ligase [Prosthecomicrobium hirschii]TPQ51686.1 glutamate--tRNA ligase [Prosthecomicrobium hirschii]